MLVIRIHIITKKTNYLNNTVHQSIFKHIQINKISYYYTKLNTYAKHTSEKPKYHLRDNVRYTQYTSKRKRLEKAGSTVSVEPNFSQILRRNCPAFRNFFLQNPTEFYQISWNFKKV